MRSKQKLCLKIIIIYVSDISKHQYAKKKISILSETKIATTLRASSAECSEFWNIILFILTRCEILLYFILGCLHFQSINYKYCIFIWALFYFLIKPLNLIFKKNYWKTIYIFGKNIIHGERERKRNKYLIRKINSFLGSGDIKK